MATPSPSVGASRPSLVGRLGSVRPVRWLALAMLVYFVVSVTYSWLRVVELETNTWDLGIYQQALWSTAHGRAFFESPDLETGGFGTFLQVHSAFVLYLVVPVYEALPYQETLLVIQSAIVAAAAYPLYLLGSDVTGSPKLGLSAGVLYLAWAPTLAANLYDFHIESFLPVEIFAFVVLWNRGRYGWGLLVAALSFATMEIAPVLLFFAGAFFLLPPGRSALQALRAVRASRDRLREGVAAVRRFLRLRRSLAAIGLMGLSASAYYLDLFVREHALSVLIGVPAFPATPSGYVIGGTPSELGLFTGNLAADFTAKLLSWVILLALLGFVPLLAPRALLLNVPWVGISFLSGDPNFHVIGWQYGFIEAAGLFTGFAFGLGEIVRIARDRHPRAAAFEPPDPPLGSARARPHWTRRISGRPARISVALGFVVLIAVNVAASPIDPSLHFSNDLGGGYRLWTVPPPGFASAAAVAGLVPPGAPVLASDNLFPLVANDVRAYTLFWQVDDSLRLPFNASVLPEYAFLSENHTYAVPQWLSETLYNRSDYGVRAVAWSTPVGAVLLFETGFRGSPSVFGPAPPPVQTYTGAGLDPQAGGALLPSADPQYPTVVESSGAPPGLIWSAPYADLSAGTYAVTLGLLATPEGGSAAPSNDTSVLFVNSGAFAQPLWFQENLTYGALRGTGWHPIHVMVNVPEPSIEVEVRGYLSDPDAQVQIAFLSIAAVG